MLEFDSAAVVATSICLIIAIPLLRTIYFAVLSSWNYQPTICSIVEHYQLKNDEGEPIQLRLKYRYKVCGQEYSGSRYYFGSLNESNSELLKRYPVGSECTVYYDVAKPSRSALCTGLHPRLWFWIATTVFVDSIAWVVILFLLTSVN